MTYFQTRGSRRPASQPTHAHDRYDDILYVNGTMHEDRKHTIAALHGVTVGAASDDAWSIASSERGSGRRSSDPVNLDQKGCFFFQICSTPRPHTHTKKSSEVDDETVTW
jgi:hypothetical protein